MAQVTEERAAQKSYWLEHSSQPTVEAMMLDSKASEIDQLERPEVLSTLGSVAGKRVLELGAGIGRFTGELAKSAKSVTACDFMETSIAENRRQHEQMGNTSFVVGDVTELEQEAGSYDVVFSNWLLMYLSDAEVKTLAAKILSWLSPGGILFFRESCFRPSGDRPRKGNPTHYSWNYTHAMCVPLGTVIFRESCFRPSGDRPRKGNPTHYRNPRDYFAMFDKAELPSSDGASSAHLELVCCKCVDTYVTVKKNQNQICWKYQKVVTPVPRPPLYRTFLDTNQYSDRSIALYEAVYGQGYLSPGGADKSAQLLDSLRLKASMRIIDVGCGIGGNAFLAADTYGCHVHGIDLSVNSVLVAIERAAAAVAKSRSGGGGIAVNGSTAAAGRRSDGLGMADGSGSNGCLSPAGAEPQKQQQAPHDVTFEVADVLTRDFPEGSFDVCISRDALVHVADKQTLASRLYRWLRPGGKLLITDYCMPPDGDTSAGFQNYIQKRGYSLLSVQQYSDLLTAAGFADIDAQDRTEELVQTLEAELQRLQANKAAITAQFTEAEYNELVDRWNDKLQRAKAGEQLWGKVTAVKPQQ